MLPTLIGIIVVSALAGGIVAFHLRRKQGTKASGEVKQLTGALQSKDVQAEILIESISDGIIVTNTEGQINLFNNAAATMTQWPIEEAMSIDVKSVLKLLKNEKTNEYFPDQEHPFTQVLQTRQRYNQTIKLINRSNTPVFISLVISPVIVPKNNELVGAVAVFRDVTRERSEEQRRAEFISTASHEMRTPVAAIEGYLALALNDKVSTIDAKAREYLEKAHSSTQHLGKLFQDLLTSAKAEDGRLTSHPVVVEMGQFVEDLADDLKFGAQKKGLEVEFIASTTSPSQNSGLLDATSTVGRTIRPLYYVHVDPDRIREVITNVFDNAVKYTETGKVSLGITGNDEVVQIHVQDTGPGIPPNDVQHLFEKFYRVDNTATRSIGGTGLGLFICRKIVELYNGMIWAESTVGTGSTFYINLPRISTQRATEMQKAERTSPAVG